MQLQEVSFLNPRELMKTGVSSILERPERRLPKAGRKVMFPIPFRLTSHAIRSLNLTLGPEGTEAWLEDTANGLELRARLRTTRPPSARLTHRETPTTAR